ncbi:MAG: DUF3196 family protein [Erysipelotrichaceae bacterium]
MDIYYKEIINGIEKAIKDGDYKEAYGLCEDELKMPYIPKDAEDIIIRYYNECKSELDYNKSGISYSFEDIPELLKSKNAELQFMALELLKGSNIRNYLKEIEEYLNDKPNYFLRSLIIECLIEQQVNENIHLEDEDMVYDFMPCYLEPPLESDGAILAFNLLSDWFENDNPSFLKLCVDTLIKELYLKLPQNVEEDESISLAKAIVCYVFKANQDEEGYNSFISKKSLAKIGDYALLLYKHDI